MKTRQHTYESENSEYEEGLENSENLDSKEQIREEIQTTVDERGFYLYEWISREELKMSIRADYLNIATKSSIPLYRDFCDGSYRVCTRKYYRNYSRDFWDFISLLPVCWDFFDFQNASKMKYVFACCERDFYRQSYHRAFQSF